MKGDDRGKTMTFKAFAKSLEADENYFVTAEFSRQEREGIGSVPVITERACKGDTAAHERFKAYFKQRAGEGGRT